jgi:hypothetical protein
MLFIRFVLISLFWLSASLSFAQCDFYANINASVSGFNAGFNQQYVLVSNNTGSIGRIQSINTTGEFIAVTAGSYFVYCVNYQGVQPAVLTVGNLWSGVTTYASSNCFAVSIAYLNRAITVCNIDQNVCLTNNIQVNTSGHTTSAGFSQTFILVNSANTVLATNTTGNFTPAQYVSSGIFSVYAVNTNNTNVTNTFLAGNSFNNVRNACVSNCASLLGPRIISVNACTPLPVELVYFNGQKQGSSDLLEWSTQTEVNNDYFEIEASTNGLNFSRIGRVQGSGNSSQTKKYQFLNQNPLALTTYYRLKQVDYQGNFKYSKVISLSRKQEKTDVLVYPNPAQNDFNINIPSEFELDNASIEITDLLGKRADFRLVTLKQGSNQFTFDTSVYPSATYLVKVYSEKTIYTPIKLVVTK